MNYAIILSGGIGKFIDLGVFPYHYLEVAN